MKDALAPVFQSGRVKIVASGDDSWYNILIDDREVGSFRLGAAAYDSDPVGVPVALLRALIRKD